MAAVIFTVDAEHATGHAPVANEDVRRRAARHADVLIPFASASTRPRGGAASGELRAAGRRARRARRQVPPQRCRGSRPTTARPTRLYEVLAGPRACRRSSTPARPASARGCRAAAGIKLRLLRPDAARRRRRRLPRADDHPGAPVGPLAGLGDLRSPRTSRTCTSTCPAGRRSTSRRSWCGTRTPCCRTRCCSARTTRSSTPDRWLADFAELEIKDRGPPEDPQGQRGPRPRPRVASI